jgi:hypothetical protein
MSAKNYRVDELHPLVGKELAMIDLLVALMCDWITRHSG